ncbi:DUF202 domain-containing protein [Corynebacterium poyangense]|uniref:DUF202 domain-containing protein n=1 Tax=Corynebacterium poyangense TaxID=2684405 RepID=A0A7H0SSA6_9CORY|nr:DUF202 domain-containing protein [Corynebacterium poyangense]
MSCVTHTSKNQESDDRGVLARVLLPGGKEPDARFTLANERTFLAWTRTSLAFMAGGVALEAFPIDHVSPAVRTTMAICVIAVGLVIALGASVRWVRVERAMRHDKPLPVPAIIPVLSLAAVLASATAIWVFLI